jgi:small subunit ribosomal protein S16
MVVAEDSSRRDGRFIEIVGFYDPLQKPASIEVKADAVLKWLSQGAQPTDTVRRILAKTGVWAHWRAVQAGQAELDGLSGRIAGTIERDREPKPSAKTATRIAAEAEAEAAKQDEPGAETAGAETAGEDAADESASAGSD